MESLKDKNKEVCSSSLVNVFETFFKDFPDGVVYKDENFNFVSINKAYCDIFQIINYDNVLGQSQMKFLSDTNYKLVCDVNCRLIKEKHHINYVLNLENNNPNRLLYITSTPIFENDIFKGVFSIVKDITEEEYLKENFVMHHSRLESLLGNIPMLIYMQDKASRYIVGTKQADSFFNDGYDSFENIKFTQNIIKEVNLKENNLVFSNNQILVKTKKIYDINSNTHWYKIYKIPINDINGKITGIITISYNIDKEIRLQTQRETFVATISHDLKNPTIAQIRGIELILKGLFGEIKPEQKELLEMVLDSCRYMNGMLSSLLATYRDYSGVIKLKFQEFSLSELVNECVSEMIYVAKDKEIKININDTSSNSVLNADRVQIKRVIMNLISNGIKYAEKNTELLLFILNENKNLCFKFMNYSPYIPEDKQKNIFARYVTYAQNHKELGIGLGLYASQKIVEAHNGSMFVKSFKENKNIFGFYLPNDLSVEKNIYEVAL